MNYRHEWKHEINYTDYLTLKLRLSGVMKVDAHAQNNRYFVRSLYFDNLFDKALREKQDGVNMREKYRIRYYNGDTSFISLEKKSKINGLCSKEATTITKEEVTALLQNDTSWLLQKDDSFYKEFYSKIKGQGLRPKTIVDYTREPFIYLPGNVRVTIDYNIRTGDFRTDFFSPETITLPIDPSPIILEVKWDEYLPDIIKDLVTIPGRPVTAFSKYEQCRIYG